MKIKYLLVSILLFLFITPKVNAYCSKDNMLKVKEKANNITLKTQYHKNENNLDTGNFNITFEGLTQELYILNQLTGEKYYYNNTNNGTFTIKNLPTGNYTFTVHYDICYSELMRTINYKLPKYNHYANDKLCEGLKDEIDICSRNYQGELTKEEFEKKVKEYRKDIGIKEPEEIPNTTFEKIVDLLLKYYPYIIIGIIVIVGITIKLVINKKRGALE